MKYKILVIDDDESMHAISRGILGKEFNLEHAWNAQQAIDLLSNQQFNLVLSDIHMPGLGGLEFLESLMKDADKQQIPVLIMTHLPTVEKEKRALDLGAADFIDKTFFAGDKEEILKRVRMKLVTNLKMKDLDRDLVTRKNKLIREVMFAAIKKGFEKTVEVLCQGLKDQFNTDHISFWLIKNEAPSLMIQKGSIKPEGYTGNDLKSEHSFKALTTDRKPYLTNHIFDNDLGTMEKFSSDNNLPAEIGVPLFAVDEYALLMNNMEVPDDAVLFGLVLLKRNKLFSTGEFELVSQLLTQTGSILWRLSGKD